MTEVPAKTPEASIVGRSVDGGAFFLSFAIR